MEASVRNRLLPAIAAVIGALVIPFVATAQSWPTRPVTMIVPFPAGGSSDLVARAVARELGERLGQQFVIDNRSGAAGNVGATAAAKAAPDGYTILFSTPGPIALNKLMYRNLPFDSERDFTPVILIGKTPDMIVAPPAAPAKNLGELLAYAKANPGKLNAGVPGIGTTSHFALELLMHLTGAKMTVVAFRGGGPLIANLLGGQVDFGIAVISSLIPHAAAGKLRALAVTSTTRSKQLANVPTVEEEGFQGFDAASWTMLAVPVRTQSEIVQKLNAAVNAYLQSEKGKQQLSTYDVHPAGGTPQEAKAFVASEIAKWAPIVKAANLSM